MSTTSTTDLLKRRAAVLGPNLPTFYETPLHIVRGQGVWLWDAEGRKYLDCYNNVPHVGHCHPRVTEAICQQAATLNTHTRYLHEGLLDYAERLTATMAAPLSNFIMVCTGSEANDIALRMAQAVTGKTGVIATDATYHGNTAAVSRLSRGKRPAFDTSDNVRYVPAPDSYRPDTDPAAAFADAVRDAIDDLERSGYGFSALILCPYFANEGFPDLPAGFLDDTASAVRAAGGLLIADEVQPGFGRTGSHFWGHQRIGITPDVVTMGKPMGNGHPVAGVVTSPEIMAEFRTAFSYFNTFGGNPVSVAAATAVLDVMQDESLLQNAETVGSYARAGLSRLANKHEVIGDVRGAGLFFGAELVLDRSTKAPATAYAARVANAMKDRGIILNTLGRHRNITKIRPPMCFATDHADLMLDTLDQVLTELPPAP
jgi:4-aminobutyrate aminotransferase-like enzyme